MKEKNNPQNKIWKYAIIFLVFLFLTSLGFNAHLFLRERRSIETNIEKVNDKYNLLNPARKFVKQEDLIINFQPLRDYLKDKYEKDSNVSIYFEYQPTGSNISLNNDAEFYPASLLKVPVAMAVARKIEKGEWKWNNELVLMSTDKDDKFGTLYREPTTSTHTIEDLVERSLSESDNTAHFMLVRNLEMKEVQEVYDHMGLPGFLKTEGSLSAKKYSVMFRALHNPSYLTEDNSQKLLSYLANSPFDDYIQSILPKDIIFAHKIGVDVEKKVYLDSGVIYAQNRPYIITIMTKNKDGKNAKKIMADISEKVYNYVKEYRE